MRDADTPGAGGGAVARAHRGRAGWVDLDGAVEGPGVAAHGRAYLSGPVAAGGPGHAEGLTLTIAHPGGGGRGRPMVAPVATQRYD